MKTKCKILLAAVVAASLTNAAVAQNSINFDEFGNGTSVFGGVTNTLGSTIATDPNSGLTTLMYFLPFPGGFGDLVVSELPGAVSDILRFDGNGHLFIFSDNSDVDSPTPSADVGFPAGLLPVIRFIQETGPEAGPNGVFGYAPVPGDPGDNSFGAVYNFISDPAPVPEPGALSMFSVGLGIFGLRCWNRRSLRQ